MVLTSGVQESCTAKMLQLWSDRLTALTMAASSPFSCQYFLVPYLLASLVQKFCMTPGGTLCWYAKHVTWAK